ncbi:type VI secretion system baseplate subunit TssF [Escherichia coli]|nr:type VI secretion system baseplate subunit TssF [Escherichia coli]
MAFLTGNLRQKIEDEFPELTHGLIKMLWPNYLRPVPAMTLIEYTPDMDKSSVPVLIPVMSSLQPTPGKSELMKCCPLMLKRRSRLLYLHPLPGYLAAARSPGAD